MILRGGEDIPIMMMINDREIERNTIRKKRNPRRRVINTIRRIHHVDDMIQRVMNHLGSY